MNTILSAIGKRLPKRIDFTDSYGLGAVIGLFFIFLFVACAWFVSTYEKGYPVPSGYMRIMEDGELVSAQELLTKKQMAHSKPVPIDSVTTVETFVAERNGFSTKVSYTVGLTLANDLGTQRMLARIYTSLPKTLVKDSFTGDILTPDPIKDLIKLTMDPAVEQIVTDIENGSTNASSSALNIRFRQIVELHKKDLPSWIQVIDPESVHITGWKFDRGELIQGK